MRTSAKSAPEIVKPESCMINADWSENIRLSLFIYSFVPEVCALSWSRFQLILAI